MSALALDLYGKKLSLKELLDKRAVLRVISSETWTRLVFDKDDPKDSRIRLSAVNKVVLCRTPINALKLGNAISG